jgi:hypothetical protein
MSAEQLAEAGTVRGMIDGIEEVARTLMAFAEHGTGKRHKVTEIECRPKGDESWVYEIVEF